MKKVANEIIAGKVFIIDESLKIIEDTLPRMHSYVKRVSLRKKFHFFLEQVERIMTGENIAVDEAGQGYILAKELGRLGVTANLEMEELIKALYTLRQTFWKYIEEHDWHLLFKSPNEMLLTVRKINEYLSQINLAIAHEYITKEREIVIVQRAALEKRQAQIENELKLARKIQQSIFPSRCEYRTFKSCAKMIPSGSVGGDFYDILPFGDSANRVDLYIGDVQGKGIPAALLMMMIISILWDTANPNDLPQQILAEVNRRLRSHISEELTQFVSLFYLSYFSDTKEVRFAKAGHEDGLLLRAKTNELLTLTASGYFLGVFDDAEYEVKRISVNAGDRIYLFTDGINTIGDLSDAPFTYEDFVALLVKHNKLPIGETLDSILNDLVQANGPYPLKDDIALLVVEF